MDIIRIILSDVKEFITGGEVKIVSLTLFVVITALLCSGVVYLLMYFSSVYLKKKAAKSPAIRYAGKNHPAIYHISQEEVEQSITPRIKHSTKANTRENKHEQQKVSNALEREETVNRSNDFAVYKQKLQKFRSSEN